MTFILRMILLLTLPTSLLAATTYQMPEQIQCRVNDAGQLHCQGFERKYLTEDSYIYSMQKNIDKILHFYSAEAYFSPDHSEATIVYQYQTLRFKWIKLITTNTTIKPNLERGAWRAVSKNVYKCNDGPLLCGFVS